MQRLRCFVWTVWPRQQQPADTMLTDGELACYKAGMGKI